AHLARRRLCSHPGALPPPRRVDRSRAPDDMACRALSSRFTTPAWLCIATPPHLSARLRLSYHHTARKWVSSSHDLAPLRRGPFLTQPSYRPCKSVPISHFAAVNWKGPAP